MLHSKAPLSHFSALGRQVQFLACKNECKHHNTQPTCWQSAFPSILLDFSGAICISLIEHFSLSTTLEKQCNSFRLSNWKAAQNSLSRTSIFFNWRTLTYVMHQLASLMSNYRAPLLLPAVTKKKNWVFLFSTYTRWRVLSSNVFFNHLEGNTFSKVEMGKKEDDHKTNPSSAVVKCVPYRRLRGIFFSSKKIVYLSQGCKSKHVFHLFKQVARFLSCHSSQENSKTGQRLKETDLAKLAHESFWTKTRVSEPHEQFTLSDFSLSTPYLVHVLKWFL